MGGHDSPQTEEGDSPAGPDAPPEAHALAWWKRSAPRAAGAALAIGAGTLWFGNMLGRVPLDQHATFAYLLMLPMLLIVPAFSLAALRLAWAALGNRATDARNLVVVLALVAALCNLIALSRFCTALWRIFAN